MSKAKLFLYDFITDKKIKRYIIAIAIFGAAAFYWREVNPGLTLGRASMSSIGLSIAFMTTLYSILSYSVIDRIKAYLMLPCTKAEVFFSFVFAQYFSLLLERMSFIIIAALFFAHEPVIVVGYLLLSSLCTVILDVVLMVGVNRKMYFFPVAALSLVAGLYILLIYSRNAALNFAVLTGVLLLSAALLMRFDAKHLAINRESKVKGHSFRRSNYFFTILMREKVVLINTVSIFAVAAVFAFISKETPFLLAVVWGVAAMNTPATTMFSGDKALARQEKMLPRSSRLMGGVYASFLGLYFLAVNAYVLLLFSILDRFSIYAVLTGLAFTIIETGISLFLERRYPIREWQKKQDVWRNPRKYVLPLIVCIIAFMPYLLGIL